MKRPNRYGKGKIPIATTIPEEAAKQLRQQAAANNETPGAYARRLLLRGLRKPILVIETDDDTPAPGKSFAPPESARIVSARTIKSTHTPSVNEPADEYGSVSRRGSSAPPSAPARPRS